MMKMALLTIRYKQQQDSNSNWEKKQQQHFCFRLNKTDISAVKSICGDILYFNPALNSYDVIDISEVVKMVAKDNKDRICRKCGWVIFFNLLPIRWKLIQQQKMKKGEM